MSSLGFLLIILIAVWIFYPRKEPQEPRRAPSLDYPHVPTSTGKSSESYESIILSARELLERSFKVNTGTSEGYKEAVQKRIDAGKRFELALAIDGSAAQDWFDLGLAYDSVGGMLDGLALIGDNFGNAPPSESLIRSYKQKSISALQKAVELDPDFEDAQELLKNARISYDE